MKYDVFQLPDSHQQVLDQTPESRRVSVTLLDHDNHPLARGTAALPLFLGVGLFWPESPMPSAKRLATAKRIVLPSGETLKLKELCLCEGLPQRYDFWVSQP